MSTLQEKNVARIKQARYKKIRSKAWDIVDVLGQNRSPGNHEVRIYTGKSFEIEVGGGVIIEHDGGAGWFHAAVKYEGRTVFEESLVRIKSFVPGQWEAAFNRLWRKAVRAKAAKIAAMKRKEK